MHALLMQLMNGLRLWGSAALLVFPARRRLRRVEAENTALHMRVSDLEELRGLAVDVAGMLSAAAKRADQPF